MKIINTALLIVTLVIVPGILGAVERGFISLSDGFWITFWILSISGIVRFIAEKICKILYR